MNFRLGFGPVSLRLTPWTIGLGVAILGALGAVAGAGFSFRTWIPQFLP